LGSLFISLFFSFAAKKIQQLLVWIRKECVMKRLLVLRKSWLIHEMRLLRDGWRTWMI
jgi:hypothetical protein